MSFFDELKRRNVFKVAAVYAIVGWLILQVGEVLAPALHLPGWINSALAFFIILGFPLALIFAWAFELTPEGLKLEKEVDRARSMTQATGRKLNATISILLGLALVYFIADKFWLQPRVPAEPPASAAAAPVSVTADTPPPTPAAAARSIAVLPFAVMSAGMDDGYFADGLTEEILNALAQLPELLVTARTSAFAFKGQDLPVQEIAARLGVRHIVEGSVRRSGERLRVTAQLIRAEDGFHVWSENYDSTEQDTIAVQEDIAEKIALAMDVVLDDGKREAMRRAGLRDVEAFIAFQKGTELYEQAHGHERMIAVLRQANAHFEVVRRRVPGYVPAYIKHSDLYIHILMNEATGQSSGSADAAEIAEALPHAIADFEAAARLARNDAERDNAELDLAFISSDWRGIAARIERFIAQDGCEDSIWSDNIAVVTGYAERLQPRAEKQIQCNPLLTTKWQSAVRQKVWAGNPAGALEAGRQGARRAPGPWIYNQLVAALVAQGEFEQAEQTIAEHVRADFDALMNRMLVAAARGDRPAFDALLEEYETIPGESGYYDLMFSAWAGDRERANGIARRIDGHVFGSPALMTISMWCLCGAPFDLAVTPNLAANLEESGLPWPPPSPIRFPLKEQGFGERIALRLED